MSQFALFDETGPRTILDRENGSVVYTPHIVTDEVADRWFDSLKKSDDWQVITRRMYDRDVVVPRLIASYRTTEPMPDVINDMIAVVRSYVTVEFTSVQLNFYRDKNDSVSPHGDSVEEIYEGAPIVLISLGGTRTMVIKEIHGSRRSISFELEHGSLLEMSYDMQIHYTHAIPKVNYHVDPRISVVFRKRLDEATASIK